MSLRLGCDLPYFEDPDDIRSFATAAEEIGFDHIGFSEHVASSRVTEYPALFSFDDPWHESFTMLAFLAAVTSTIELSSAMALITLRNPVLVAKQAAEVDLLSRGRLRLARERRLEPRGATCARRRSRRHAAVASRRWCRCSVVCGPRTQSRTTGSRSRSTKWASTRGRRARSRSGWAAGGSTVAGPSVRAVDAACRAARRRVQADGADRRRRRPRHRYGSTTRRSSPPTRDARSRSRPAS